MRASRPKARQRGHGQAGEFSKARSAGPHVHNHLGRGTHVNVILEEREDGSAVPCPLEPARLRRSVGGSGSGGKEVVCRVAHALSWTRSSKLSRPALPSKVDHHVVVNRDVVEPVKGLNFTGTEQNDLLHKGEYGGRTDPLHLEYSESRRPAERSSRRQQDYGARRVGHHLSLYYVSRLTASMRFQRYALPGVDSSRRNAVI